MDLITFVPTAALYLSDGLAKGFLSGIGKDVWESLKGNAKKPAEVKTIESFEREPKVEKNIGRIESMIEEWMEVDTSFKENIIALNKEIALEENSSQKIEMKNIVNNSDLSNNSGKIHIGDKN